MLWVWDAPTWLSVWLTPALSWVTCRIWGHDPQSDQCGNPEHDFCSWCLKWLPNSAPRRPAPVASPDTPTGDQDA